MALVVYGCSSSSFSCSKIPCFVCWRLSVLVNSCGGCYSRCCSCQGRTVVLGTDFGKLFVFFGPYWYGQRYNNVLVCPRGCTPVAGQSDYRPTMDTGRYP